jgi:hypothetical protein
MQKGMKEKIALFCNVDATAVIESRDAETIYDVPMMMQAEGLDQVVLQKLAITGYPEADLSAWKDFLHRYKEPKSEVHIGLVGKYVELKDAYKSIKEALEHAGAENETKVHIKWVHSEKLNAKNVAQAPGWSDRHRGSPRLRAPRYRRQDRSDQVCTREQDPLPRDLPGHAVRGDRIRSQRPGPRPTRIARR